MTDQDTMSELRKSNIRVANALDDCVSALLHIKDETHGSSRATIVQLAKFLEGDAFSPFPEER